jgi:DNA-binding transcriptional ArsR family regulator
MAKNGCIPMLKALADETRWRIVSALLEKPGTITELTERLNVSQYNVSKHIRILREAGILLTEREGKFVKCFVEPALKKKWSKKNAELDLGCCRFRFD